MKNEDMCPNCGDYLEDDGLCYNCAIFNPEIDAWTTND